MYSSFLLKSVSKRRFTNVDDYEEDEKERRIRRVRTPSPFREDISKLRETINSIKRTFGSIADHSKCIIPAALSGNLQDREFADAEKILKLE